MTCEQSLLEGAKEELGMIRRGGRPTLATDRPPAARWPWAGEGGAYEPPTPNQQRADHEHEQGWYVARAAKHKHQQPAEASDAGVARYRHAEILRLSAPTRAGNPTAIVEPIRRSRMC